MPSDGTSVGAIFVIAQGTRAVSRRAKKNFAPTNRMRTRSSENCLAFLANRSQAIHTQTAAAVSSEDCSPNPAEYEAGEQNSCTGKKPVEQFLLLICVVQ